MKKKVTDTVTLFTKTSLLITVITFNIFTSLWASPSSAQILETKITTQFKSGQTLANAIEQLRAETRIKFSYDPVVARTVIVDEAIFKGETLARVLKALLKKTDLAYQEQKETIILFKRPVPNVPAGQGPGTIKGRIVEFESSQPLPGASVQIIELNKGVSSDNGGYYRLTDIPVGKYTLQISYVSFNTEKITIEVKAGQESTYDVKLQGANVLNEVVVSSVRKSRAPVAHTTERQVVEELRQAQSVVSGISSEQISRSADRNAAEVMQRVSGVTTVDDKFVVVRGLNQRYNLTYLNDNVAPSTEMYSRAFALDLIPSRIIDKVLVYKSPSPENQGDATGGVIKIYTKDARNVKHFDIELQTGYRDGTTFNKNFLTYQGGKTDFLGFDDGTRKLPSSVPKFGNLAQAKISQKQYAESFSPILAYGRKTAMPNMQLTANYYNSFKVANKTLSSLTSFSYKNERLHADVYRQQGINEANPKGTANDAINFDNRNTETAQLNLLQNFTLRLRDSSTLQFKNFILQQGQNTTIVRYGYNREFADFRGSTNKDNILSYSQRFLYAGNLGGTHYYAKGKHKLDWNGGYTYSSLAIPDQRIIRLKTSTSNFMVGDSSLQWRPRTRTGDGESSIAPITLGMISRVWIQNDEGVYNGSVNYTFQPLSWLNVKTGTFHQWKERRLFRRVFTIHEGDFTGRVTDGETWPGGYGSYLDPELVRFREQELPNVWSSTYLRDDGVGLKAVDRTQGSDAYVATEQNNSGFAAFSFTPAHRMIEVYGGLRVEYNRQQIAGAIPPTNAVSADVNEPILIDYPKLSWLPSINFGWRPNQSWVFRAAYGKTVNRFEFREAAPYKEIDYENNTEIQGNPLLKAADVENYDLRLELYPKGNEKGEMISIGAFYKNIKNPIERVNISSRISNQFPLIGFQNAVSATVIGGELEINKKLDFLPGTFLKRLAVSANLTLIKSQVDSVHIQNSSEITPHRALQGQAPYIINAGLYYDNAASGTKVSLIYNVVGPRIYAAAGANYRANPLLTGPEFRGSLLELQRHSMDIALTQRIIKSLQLKCSVQNILNQEIRVAEDYNYTWKYEPVKKVMLPDGKTTEEGDNIASAFNPGRYFQFTFSYSF